MECSVCKKELREGMLRCDFCGYVGDPVQVIPSAGLDGSTANTLLIAFVQGAKWAEFTRTGVKTPKAVDHIFYVKAKQLLNEGKLGIYKP